MDTHFDLPLWNVKYNFIENASPDEMDVGGSKLVYVSIQKYYLFFARIRQVSTNISMLDFYRYNY